VFEAALLPVHPASFREIATASGLSLDSPPSPEIMVSGQRVHDVYLNDPELERFDPLGLLPWASFIS
jgi:hypothetical protein